MRMVHHGSALLGLALILVSSCGPPPAPPGPGEARGSIPDLRGTKVMVLPVQLKTFVSQELLADAELEHALRNRGEGVSWVFPPELEEALRRSPGLSAQVRNLPVQIFLQAEVDRIGDPLFGHLVRLGGLTGANVALIPVELKYGEEGTFLLAAALVGIRTGRVAWYGVVEGSPGDVEDPAALASAAETLARTLLPFG
jgi:hypothetical protein